MKTLYKQYALALSCLLLIGVSHPSCATSYIVSGTSISLYTQSQIDSTAHMVQSSKGIYNNGAHPWCANRMYIDAADKALLATAQGVWLTGKVVNVMYDDAAPGMYIAGHVANLRCRVMSIF